MPINRFKAQMLEGIEWLQVVSQCTPYMEYRVEITWALDRYKVSVWRRVQEPEKFVECHHPLFARTAVETGNKMLRRYSRFERAR